MNGIVKYIGGLALVLGLFSCKQEHKEVVRPFKNVLNFDEEAAKLSGPLIKTVIDTERIETKTITSPNYDVELQPFIAADFNRPINKEKYVKFEESSNLAGWHDVVWVGTDKDRPVRWAIYRYINSRCIGASIGVMKFNKAYTFVENLTYIPQVGYSIENSQFLNRICTEKFYISGQFANTTQPWKMYFDIGNQNIPVNLNLLLSNDSSFLSFHQGRETITAPLFKTDSGYIAEMPVFQSYITFRIVDDSTFAGQFHNLDKGDDYIIPFTGKKLRYENAFGYLPSRNYLKISGKWETYFGTGENRTPAIGIFERVGTDLIGTFATETGDFRFLQGKVEGDSFWLSTFDGSHLFLFTGKMVGDSIVDGHFYSGNHYHTTWTAKRNENFDLTNPEEMTQVTQTSFDFTFPDLNQNPVSLSDDRFKNKVIIIQLLGSWCPNCMDETRYFVDLYNKYHQQGLEIIGLAFERSSDFETAKNSLEKALKDLDVSYTVLIAGTPHQAADVLPMIDKVKSYPTSIILDKTGEVVKVHTGFYGPSTGEYYKSYKLEMDSFIDSLLSS